MFITEQVHVPFHQLLSYKHEYSSHIVLQKDLEDNPPLEEALNSAYFGHFRGKRTVGISSHTNHFPLKQNYVNFFTNILTLLIQSVVNRKQIFKNIFVRTSQWNAKTTTITTDGYCWQTLKLFKSFENNQLLICRINKHFKQKNRSKVTLICRSNSRNYSTTDAHRNLQGEFAYLFYLLYSWKAGVLILRFERLSISSILATFGEKGR